jgi:hypothetical protein
VNKGWITKEADLPLEVVLLLIAGMALLIAGVLLFPIADGNISYYENGLYGLILVIFALQITTLGKTPFGDMGRSVPLITAGVVIGAVGIFTCFIPDIINLVPRLLLFIFLGPGGLILLLQMCLSRDKLRTWINLGEAVFKHLIAACSAVYVLSMLSALLILRKSLLTTRATAAAVLAFGASVIYLAIVLRKVYREYPEAEKPSRKDVTLSTDQVLILFTGVLMLLLGWLLIPVNLGMLPFSGSAQVGLLMVLIAFKMLASGDTPIGTFTRSWAVIILGTVLAALGITSCIVPDILIIPLMILIGLTNIVSGIVGLWRTGLPLLKGSEQPRGKVPAIMKRLFVAQLVLNVTTILFGISVFVAELIPGLVLGVILFINGGILLYLLHVLVVLGKMRGGLEGAASQA